MLDIGDVLRQTARMYKVLFDKKGNRLQMRISELLPPIMGNADQLQQVIIGLLEHCSDNPGNRWAAVGDGMGCRKGQPGRLSGQHASP